MARDCHSSNISRRSVLGTVGSTIGASSILTRVSDAVNDTNRKFVGKAYDPVTDKEQGDASAILNRTPIGLKGRLEIAGFSIPFGTQGRLTDENTHPSVETYSFVADDNRFTVEENGRELPLVVRIDMLDDRVTGTVKRPGAEYGSLAFSLNPVDQGFTSEDVGTALHPERREGIPADKISLPDEGIPKSNSIQNTPTVESEGTAENKVGTSEYIQPIGGGDGDGNYDKSVGLLDTDSTPGSISENFPDRCSDEVADSSWEYNLATSSEVRYDTSGSVYTDYDEIAASGGFKRFQMQAHFTKVPDRYIQECDQDITGLPYQTGVEFWVHQAGGTTQNGASLGKPQPDGENNSSNPDDGLIGLSLELVNDIGGAYSSVGYTLINYALDGDSGGEIIVDYNGNYNNDPEREEYYWDLPLSGGSQDDNNGDDYFPDHTDNIASASFKVENGLPPEKEAFLETESRFEFAYIDYLGDGDTCPCYNAPTALKTIKTSKVSNTIMYRSVDP